MSNEQLIELLIVADRLQGPLLAILKSEKAIECIRPVELTPSTVEELSSGCQAILGSRLDCSNVLLMLSVADQWSAKHLKVRLFVSYPIICLTCGLSASERSVVSLLLSYT